MSNTIQERVLLTPDQMYQLAKLGIGARLRGRMRAAISPCGSRSPSSLQMPFVTSSFSPAHTPRPRPLPAHFLPGSIKSLWKKDEFTAAEQAQILTHIADIEYLLATRLKPLSNKVGHRGPARVARFQAPHLSRTFIATWLPRAHVHASHSPSSHSSTHELAHCRCLRPASTLLIGGPYTASFSPSNPRTTAPAATAPTSAPRVRMTQAMGGCQAAACWGPGVRAGALGN